MVQGDEDSGSVPTRFLPTLYCIVVRSMNDVSPLGRLLEAAQNVAGIKKTKHHLAWSLVSDFMGQTLRSSRRKYENSIQNAYQAHRLEESGEARARGTHYLHAVTSAP
jgi:hypothetical protein